MRRNMDLIIEGLSSIREDSYNWDSDAVALQSYVEQQLKKIFKYPIKVTKYSTYSGITIQFYLNNYDSKSVKSGATLKKWAKDSGINLIDATVSASKNKHLSGWSGESDGCDYSLKITYTST